MIPSTPDGTPLFSKFMIAILVEISIAVTVICMIINIESGISQPSNFVYLLLNKYLPALVCLRPYDVVYNDDTDEDVSNKCGRSQNEIADDENSQEMSTVRNGHLDILSISENGDTFNPMMASCSDHFREKMLQVLEGVACSSVEKRKSAEIIKERYMLAARMDRFLHAFFSIVVLLTVLVVLHIPPELNL